VLSVEGEKKAKEISEIEELKNIDALWCSNYSRAIATAKYISFNNNIQINIDKNFNERKLGNIEKLEILEKSIKNTFTTEQLIDETLKNQDGENRVEVTLRMEKAFNKVFGENVGKKIAIVSHGAAIKFLLMKWCILNSNNTLEFNKKEITLNSPGIVKLVFEGEKLINLEQIQ
jgi:uncharacterized phosphatase